MLRLSVVDRDAKHGIQNLLRHFVPDVTEVRPI